VERGPAVDPVERLPDDVRSRTIEYLRHAVGRGQLSLTEAELVALVREVAPPVTITPPERQLPEPLDVSTSGMFADVKLRGAWQLPRQLRVRTGPSRITIDLTNAEFDSWTVEIVAHADVGDLTVIVPPRHGCSALRDNEPRPVQACASGAALPDREAQCDRSPRQGPPSSSQACPEVAQAAST
jgi:hypothetical protein